ncbi:MAG TPA: uracil-DNA glycosylase [Caulobacteraceae bacterium]
MGMGIDRPAAESLLAFWAESGVDTAYGRSAVDRTVTAAPPSQRPSQSAEALSSKESGGAPAVDLARAADTLEALGLAIADFDGCPLKSQGARQAVFWRGVAAAEVMIIGEAPGADEDAQGAPFVGRAGRLLDKMLAAAGLQGRIFITNTVFWRPPGNRTPSVEEQLSCAPFLERAIELVQPKLLLLVGAAATRSLLNQTEGILALRGRWFTWRGKSLDLQTPALPTLHPAFLLRQPTAKKKAWHDLLLLTERLDRSARPD